MIFSNTGPDDVRLAYTLHNLGVCVLGTGRNAEATELLARALRIRETKLGPRDLQVAVTLHELGVGVLRVGRKDEVSVPIQRWGHEREAEEATNMYLLKYVTIHHCI